MINPTIPSRQRYWIGGISRRHGHRPLAIFVLIALGLAASATLHAKDWPQWAGPDRDGVWDETGIVDTLPPELVTRWRVPINSGYAGPAVADGRVFVTDWQEDPESRTFDGAERLLALDEETGEVLWTHQWATSYRMLMTSYAIGPRATPTVDGHRVYVLGATGRLLCLDSRRRAPVGHGLCV